jgi:hypothetical protein
VRSARSAVIAIAALFFATCTASAQSPGADAIRKLSFLSGKWVCTIAGGISNGEVQDSEYSFSPDSLWMTELSWDAGAAKRYFATQMWGYDASAAKLVAYQFTSNGVFTKTVEGWIDGAFTARRDDNGATVSVKQVGAGSVEWTIASADKSSIVKEECVRP